MHRSSVCWCVRVYANEYFYFYYTQWTDNNSSSFCALIHTLTHAFISLMIVPGSLLLLTPHTHTHLVFAPSVSSVSLFVFIAFNFSRCSSHSACEWEGEKKRFGNFFSSALHISIVNQQFFSLVYVSIADERTHNEKRKIDQNKMLLLFFSTLGGFCKGFFFFFHKWTSSSFWNNSKGIRNQPSWSLNSFEWQYKTIFMFFIAYAHRFSATLNQILKLIALSNTFRIMDLIS